MPRRSKPRSIRKRVITRAGAAAAPEFLALLQAAHLTPSHMREIRHRYGAAARLRICLNRMATVGRLAVS